MESDVLYDIEVTKKNPTQPTALRGLAFVAVCSASIGYIYFRCYPRDFAEKSETLIEYLADKIGRFIDINSIPVNVLNLR